MVKISIILPKWRNAICNYSYIQRYEISSITSEISQEKPANLKLNVGDTFYDSISSAHVVGEVTNNGPGVSRFTQVSGTFYDNQGKTVATEFTFTDPQDLQPGQSAPFDMIISDETSADIVSGSLNVQSSEFAMILPAVVFEMSGQVEIHRRISDHSEGDQLTDQLMMKQLMKMKVRIMMKMNPAREKRLHNIPISMS